MALTGHHPGFGLDQPTGSDRDRGSPHLSVYAGIYLYVVYPNNMT